MMNGAETTYREIIGHIRSANSILVTSHREPDGDSIGTQLAMLKYVKSLGKDAVIVNHGDVPGKYRFLPNIELIKETGGFRAETQFDLAIILECCDLKRTGNVEHLIDETTKIINIDHHPDNTGFGDVVLVDTRAAAVAEILAEFFLDTGFQIDGETASQLFAAILTDTGRFRFNSTTRRTMEIGGLLIELGADPRKICDEIYYSMTKPMLSLTGELLSRIKLYEKGKLCLMSVGREALKKNNSDLADTEGMAEYTLYIRGVLAGGMLREIDAGRTKVSLRSRGNLDVSRLAHKYGGGGHHNASGFTLDLPLKAAEERLLEELKELIYDKL